MTSLSLAQGGPRPADLPPTLQPHAIAAMAPATNKRLTAALSVLTYAFLGSGLALVAAVKTGVVAAPKLPKSIEVEFESSKKEPVQAHLQEAPPKGEQAFGTGTRPENVEAVAPQTTTEPTETPTTLPTAPTGPTGAFDPELPVGPQGTGGSPDGKQGITSTPGQRDGVVGAGGTGPVSVDASAVSIRSQVQPNYPQMARLTRIQGPVVLKMTIDAQGVPTDVQMVSGNPVFQAEAVRAARLWCFTPAMVGGQPVAAVFHLTINFTLRS